MPEFVDTHCHIQSAGSAVGEEGTRRLWDKSGRHAPAELFKKGQDHGVTTVICVGCDVDDSQLAIDCASTTERIFASIGIHPHEAQRYADNTAELSRFVSLASRPKVVAVGECGLDYYYEHSPRGAQAAMLRFQIELAQQHDLPIIFHVREAFDDFWPIFDAFPGIRGVLHSFTDIQTNLQLALDRGLYIGVNGIATFTKNPEQHEMYKNVPLSRLLLETDSPFLTPSPWRGNICEPYHTSVTAEYLATLRNEPLNELAASTTENAQKLFNF